MVYMEDFELPPISLIAELNFRKDPRLRRSIAAATQQYVGFKVGIFCKTREAPPARKPRDYASRYQLATIVSETVVMKVPVAGSNERYLE
jgi:hypothetical protein